MAFNLSALTAQQQAAAIYIGYYDRAPDPYGMDFWEAAVSLVSLADIATFFSAQEETYAVHPFFVAPSAIAANAFITELYMNLFNRAPDIPGLTFWSGVLQQSIDGTGPLSVGEIILAIIEGAQNSAEGQDITTLLNKIEVANAWTDAAAAAGLTEPNSYGDSEVAQASAKSIIDGVTFASSSVDTAKAEITSTFENFVDGSKFTLTADAPSILEGDSGTKVLVFKATLDEAPTQAISVNYETLSSGTAASGDDFIAAAGVVTFAPGQTVATVSVTVLGDATFEADETIQLKFSGARLTADVTTTGTITNDDIDPQVALGAAYTAAKATYDAAVAAAATSSEAATDAQTAADLAETAVNSLATANAYSTAAQAAQTAAVAAQADAAAVVTAAAAVQAAAAATLSIADDADVAGVSATALAAKAAADTAKLVADAEVANAAAQIVNYTGQTYTLTTGVDSFTATGSNDTFNALPGAANANTLTALDNIDGGAGIDTLNVAEIGAAGVSPYVLNTAATISNVEILNYTVSTDNAGDAVTADVSDWGDFTTVNIVVAGTDAPVSFLTTKANVTSASVTGATTAAITDSAAAGLDKLASVSLVNTTGLATITSDAMTSLSMTGALGGATILAAAATRDLTVNLNATTAGTITDAEATSVTVNAIGAPTTGVTLTAAKATSVTLNADEALTLADINVAAATNITITGEALTTITAASTVTALTSINASGSTGGADVDGFVLGTGVAFTGGNGADAVQLGATTKAITMGAGDDLVTMTAAVGTGGSVNGGDGTDTLSLSAADAVAFSANATFEAGISNFETLSIGQVADAAATVNINLANLDDISTVTFAGFGAGALANVVNMNNFAAGGTLTLTGAILANDALNVNVKDAAIGAADTFNLVINDNTGITNTGNLVIDDVEMLNITSDDADDTGGNTPNTPKITAAAATTVNVDGDMGIDFTGSIFGAITTLDASGVTLGDVSYTGGAIGLEGASTAVTTFATMFAATGVSITGGVGDDVLIGNSATGTADIISGGEGDDTITGAAGDDVLTGGAGDDLLTGAAGADVLTGGEGNDIFDYDLSSDSTLINLDVIADFFANTVGNGTAGAADDTGATTTAADRNGDVIDISGIGAFTKIDVSVQSNASDAQTFLQNLAVASAADVPNLFVGAALDASSGRLYLDFDEDGTVDSVIELTGVTTIDEAAFII
jgi:S-layer protein